ncbi:MAG: pteridine reductase [Thiotrichaceae bacterium]
MGALQGKTVLLTGAARRIGAVVAKVLHQEGASIVIHYRNSSEDAQLLIDDLNKQREHSAFTVQADLCQIETFDALIAKVIAFTGRLDVLINNASSFYPTPIGSVTEAHWDDLHCSNLKAPFFLSQAVTPELQKRQGCIVNMVDIHGIRPLKGYPVYSAMKAGLIMLTKSLAKELGPDIRVNGIAPGAIMWPEGDNNDSEVDKKLKVELLARTALNCQGSPEDIAKAILFLIRDADYITGHVIPVDGGRLLNQ